VVGSIPMILVATTIVVNVVFIVVIGQGSILAALEREHRWL
jgi:hypothetical protein